MNAPASSPSRLLWPQGGETGTNTAKSADAIRVMLIDDSLTVRTIFKRMVESDPQMVAAATASSAERGIAQLTSLGTDSAASDGAIDVILLDLEMPGMGGLEALPTILKTAPHAQVMVVSSLTEDGAEATVQALSLGAADTMLKPRPGGFDEDYRSQLLGKIRALGLGNGDGPTENAQNPEQRAISNRARRPEVLAIGASTGGIHGINVMLRALTPDFDLPILITQHLPSSFIPVFARQIATASGRVTHIADEGTEIRKGEIAIATGHGHMILRRMGDRLITGVLAEPVASGCFPSVDPMLASLAQVCDGRALAVILSGMGRDGIEGAELLASSGGTIWAQDADTSAVWGMPGAVTKAGLTSLVASPEALGAALMSNLARSSATAEPAA